MNVALGPSIALCAQLLSQPSVAQIHAPRKQNLGVVTQLSTSSSLQLVAHRRLVALVPRAMYTATLIHAWCAVISDNVSRSPTL